jgi:hypothetical protein
MQLAVDEASELATGIQQLAEGGLASRVREATLSGDSGRTD